MQQIVGKKFPEFPGTNKMLIKIIEAIRAAVIVFLCNSIVRSNSNYWSDQDTSLFSFFRLWSFNGICNFNQIIWMNCKSTNVLKFASENEFFEIILVG